MILFGTRTMTSSQGGGVFNCPRCGPDRNYDHKRLNRWFTLYFIPCIPLGSAGQYVECTACGETYGEEVLSYDPAAEQAKTFEQIRRLVVLVLAHGERLRPENVSALRSAMQELTGNFVTEEQIQEDARLAQQAGEPLMDMFRRLGSEYNADGKTYLLQVTRDCLCPPGHVGMPERQTLEQAADAIDVPRDVLEQIIVGGNE